MRGRCWLLTSCLALACAGRSERHAPSDEGTAGDSGRGALELEVCDPLAPRRAPFELEASQVIAAGRAADGSVYVVYQGDRLFVGHEDGLLEQDVLAAGRGGGGLILWYDEPDTQVSVELEHDESGLHLTLARGTPSKTDSTPRNGEALTLLEAEAAAELPASTVDRFALDYAASLPDRRELVVIAPARAVVDDQRFRVFLGPSSSLAERPSVFGSIESGPRYASVTIDGSLADLVYVPKEPASPNPEGGPSTLTSGGTTYPLTASEISTLARFLCLPD